MREEEAGEIERREDGGLRESVDEIYSPEIQEIFHGVFKVPDPANHRKKLLATRNLTPGISFYGERLVRLDFLDEKNVEFRLWDPFRSKLSASIIRGLRNIPFKEGGTCLYLGASTGTTPSHVSDILGKTGRLFAVEVAPRVAREFLENVVRHRENIIPIVSDARRPDNYNSVYGKISTVYCDIAQPDQTDIAIINCNRFFIDSSEKGTLFLVVKASSIDVLKNKEKVFEDQKNKLLVAGFEIMQLIDLDPYDKNHAMIVSKKI